MIAKRNISLLLFLIFSAGVSWALTVNCPVDLGPDIDSCEGETIILDADTGDPSDTYEWFLNGTIIPSETSPTLAVTQSGLYSVEVDDGIQVCSDDADVIFNPLPVIATPSPMELCDTEFPYDEIEFFDLTQSADEITLGNINLIVSWHETQSNAQANIPIDPPTAYQNLANPQTIYVRVEDNSTACIDFTLLTLIVRPGPSPTTPTPLEVCDDDNDGFALFDLHLKDAEIISGEPNVTVSYHESLADAANDINELISPYINSNPFFQTVFARVEDQNFGCFTVVELSLIVNDSPIIMQNITPIFIDEGDGDEMAIFDLTVREDEILSDQDPGSSFTFNYFEDLLDAQTNTNPIANPTAYANTSNPQTIYVTVEDLDTSCYGITAFIIITDGPGIIDGDGDGVPDIVEDVNGNGNLNDDDTDDDSIPNYQDTDDDGDTVDTIDEITGIGAGVLPGAYIYIDTDGNFTENYLDDDDDGDGTFTEDEDYNGNGTPLDDDVNMNGIPDFLDPEVLGVGDNAFTDLQMYPNPSDTVVTIQSSVFSSEVTLEVYNHNGLRIISENLIPNNQSVRLNVSTLNTGMYFVRIVSEGNSAIKKLIKK